MQIETFECSEVSAEPVDATAEALELIESLGLEGQRKLICPSKAEGQNTRFPFREMLQDEVFTYERLCPTKKKISDYRASAIPLRVLQIAGMAKALMPECHLYVWDRAEAQVPDPVLVAQSQEEGYMHRPESKRWILARWGSELEAFSVLFGKAMAEKRKEMLEHCERVRAAIQAASDSALINRRDLSTWCIYTD
jgi:hypothetical protein